MWDIFGQQRHLNGAALALIYGVAKLVELFARQYLPRSVSSSGLADRCGPLARDPNVLFRVNRFSQVTSGTGCWL